MLTVNLTADSLWCVFTRTINEAVELFIPLKLETKKNLTVAKRVRVP